jgi:hypothetical protein
MWHVVHWSAIVLYYHWFSTHTFEKLATSKDLQMTSFGVRTKAFAILHILSQRNAVPLLLK